MSGVEQGFADHRNLLFSIAYRILGSAADAEDVVQDAWLRWSAGGRGEVVDVKAYLARVVTNLAVDRLRAARRRRETYVGPWLPEPILTERVGGEGGAEAAEVAESVSVAMLVVLEALGPLERAVFVLREVFEFSYGEIAEAVGRSEAAVRQAAYRARGHVRARRPRFCNDRARHRDATERFLAAAAGGDINGLMELLAPDVTLWTDGGGKVRQALRPVEGARKVAAWLAGVARRPYEGVEVADMTADVVEINGAPGIVFRGAGRVIATLTVELDVGGRVVAVHNVANPDKLGAIGAGRRYPMWVGR